VDQLIAHLMGVPVGWLLLAVGGLVFAEDALFVGFVLPGESAAIVGGAAAGLGHAPLPVVLAVVATAAVLGDSVGYLVGRHLGPRLLESRVLGRHAEAVARARLLVDRRGGAAVFLGRSAAFLRALTPALAGVAGMPYRRFAVWNVLGGLTWATVVVLVGYWAGASYAAATRLLGRGTGLAVAAVAVALLTTWLVRRRRRGERTGPRAPGHLRRTRP